MPTISKISMLGNTPIANRNLNQKASNPISANMQDSSSLNMSPNSHYGKLAVSFKGPSAKVANEIKALIEKSPEHDSSSRYEAIKGLVLAKKQEHIDALLTHKDPQVRRTTLNHIDNMFKKDKGLENSNPTLRQALHKTRTKIKNSERAFNFLADTILTEAGSSESIRSSI